MRTEDPRPVMAETPLESYSARSTLYVRAVIAIGLLLLLFIGIGEVWVLCYDILMRHSALGSRAFVIGALGATSVFFSAWALFRVRTAALRKLAALSLLSMVFATIGWIFVIASAH